MLALDAGAGRDQARPRAGSQAVDARRRLRFRSCFLACYLTYHLTNPLALIQGQGSVRPIYFTILISHVLLAATVPFLAGATIYLGLKDRRAAHRKLAKLTWPIWFYVSVTGVVVYLMLYILYPAVG